MSIGERELLFRTILPRDRAESVTLSPGDKLSENLSDYLSLSYEVGELAISATRFLVIKILSQPDEPPTEVKPGQTISLRVSSLPVTLTGHPYFFADIRSSGGGEEQSIGVPTVPGPSAIKASAALDIPRE